MKRLSLQDPVEYPADCRRIISAVMSLGYDCTLKDAEDLWRRVSDSFCAGWLNLPEDETGIINMIENFLKDD